MATEQESEDVARRERSRRGLELEKAAEKAKDEK